jgi:type II secretory pathway component PulF
LRLFPRAQLIIERRKLRLPFYGRSFRNINLFLFCDTLGHRLKHGLRLDEALSSAQEAVRSEVFRQEIARLSGDVRLGSTLSQAMRKSEWFPLSLILAAAAGELKSQVSQAFLGMARLYSRESEYGLQRIRRAAWAWVASCAAASLLFCVASFLVAIFSFFPSLYFT